MNIAIEIWYWCIVSSMKQQT